jgi:hypothetical protein
MCRNTEGGILSQFNHAKSENSIHSQPILFILIMDAVFKKMNFKDQKRVVVVNAPANFEQNMDNMAGLTTFFRNLDTVAAADFALAFCTKQAEVDAFATAAADKLEGDSLLWIAYPKGTSKRYKCDFNRDTGWAILGELGYEPVRQVAIDEDWSALRFRRVSFIKKMTRSFAMTEEGKQRVEQQKN